MINKISKHTGFTIFMLVFGIIWLFGLFFTYTVSKTDLHTYLNSFHSPFFDLFFQGITFLGDGIFALLLAILFFFIRGRKEGILLLLTFIISALLAQLLKNFVFYEEMRPLFYIQAGELKVKTVQGIKMHLNHSFPSGHTTTIFALCSMVSMFFNSKRIGLLLLGIAVFTAFSRIYLSQHFLQDTLAGSILGISTSILIWWVWDKKFDKKLNKSIEK
jgi:membrane-associated phospholipid phosphatase